MFWIKKNLRKVYYSVILIPIAFVVLSFINKKNLHKNVILEATIEDSKGSSITLFNDNTFEIRIQHQHGADFKKGDYNKEGNEVFLKVNDIAVLTDSLFTQKCIILENND